MSGRKDLLTGAALLAGLSALAALAWFALGAPLQDWRAAALERRADTVAEIARLRDSIDTLSVERAQLSGGTEIDLLWRAGQMGAATALIQSDLSRIASERGISLRSISPTRARDLALAEAAGFRLEIEAGLDQLAAFLNEIEHHSPALLVERATLRRLSKPGAGMPQPLVFAQVEVLAPIVLDVEESR